MATQVDTLLIDLKLQTAAFNTQLQQSTSQFMRTMRGMESGARALTSVLKGTLALSAISAFVSIGKAAINTADRMLELSQQTGLSVESMSSFAYAAKLSGVDVEQLAKGMSFFNRAITDALKPTSDQAVALRILNVQIREASGSLRNTEDLLLDVAERFARMGDGAAKTELAVRLFGKAGAELIPFLNEGRNGLEALRAKADELGITISTKTAKAADAFNDNLATMQERTASLARWISGPFIAAFNDWYDILSSGRMTRLEPLNVAITEQERAVGQLEQGFSVAQKSLASFRAEQALAAANAKKATQELKNQARVVTSEWIPAFHGIPRLLPEGQLDMKGIKESFEAIEAANTKKLFDSFNGLKAPGELLGEALDQLAAMRPRIDNATEGMKQLQEATVEFKSAIGQAFEDAIVNGESLRNVLQALLQDIARLILRTFVLNRVFSFLGNIFGGLFGGGGIPGGVASLPLSGAAGLGSSLTGFAEGGFMQPNSFGIVGERGPELAFAGASGATIVPMKGGGGGDIYINQDNRGADIGTVQKINQANLKLYNAEFARQMRDRASRTTR